jgi:nucleoside-diphosphate-sugar epimerase
MRTAFSMAAGGDLLVVGAGTLGIRLIEEYKATYPNSRIVACTNTTARHAHLTGLGAEATLTLPTTPFPSVVFLPTPNAKDFQSLCKQALDLWAGQEEGAFIMASSIGVFAKNAPEGSKLTESAPVNASSSNFSRTLLAAEEQVLGRGGTVMRIAGMYNLRKGRNSFFLKGGDIMRRSDAYINLVGYADVVSAAIKITQQPPTKVSGQVFIICDGHEQTVESVYIKGHECLRFLGEQPAAVRFTGGRHTEQTRGALMDNTKTREVLGWSPRVKSFEEYCSLIQQGTLAP